MKVKKEYILISLIIITLSLYLIFKNSDRTHYDLPRLDPVDRTAVTRMVVTSQTGGFTLERQDEIWRILPQGYPADQSQVDKMLDAAADFVLTTLVSESRNYVPYDLTEEKKIKVEIFGGDKMLQKYYIGKPASTHRHTYVLLEDRPGVYQARGNIRTTFDVEVARLRNKDVVTLNKDEVLGLVLASGEESLKLQKLEAPPVPPVESEEGSAPVQPQSGWQTEDGRDADEQVVNRILNSLANLKCDGYIEDKTKEDFSAPIFTLSVFGEGEVTLSIFEMENEKYPAISSQNDYPFYLPKWRAEQLIKKPDEVLGVKVEEKTGE
ncbi:MAG: DUF4340 domain-containing protein [Candidatus Krumholzibacteriota bacterium]|nr:DUF4340 domain-containing protein [Candidatus Krumholzibacteriota bacterium]